MSFIEYTNITLKMIVESGVVDQDTPIYSSSRPQITGQIKSDGSIAIILNNDIRVFSSPSAAARALVKLSTNGWIFWKVYIDSEYKDLSFLREKYKFIQEGQK